MTQANKSESIRKDFDFDALTAVTKAVLNHSETGEPIPKEELEHLTAFLNNATDAHIESPEPEKLYLLCEEHEGDDGIRSFTVLCVSRDKDALKKLLQAKVEKDEYGLIENNGINDDFETLFSSQFNDGFVSYYILEEDVLTRDQTLAKLNTKEYDPAYEYPEALDAVLNTILKEILEKGIYSDYDLKKASEHVKGDKGFQTIFKTMWWGRPEYFSVEAESMRSSISYALRSYINEQLKENPDYFTAAGAATPFVYPQNIKNLLIDAIYDVSKDYHLPVQDAGREADLILRDRAFQHHFRSLGPAALEFGTAGYENALWICQNFVRSNRIPEPEQGQESIISKLDERVAEAIQRRDTQTENRAVEGKGNSR